MPHFSHPVCKSVPGANALLRRCLVLLAGIAAAFGLVACASEVNGACGVVVDSVSGGPVGGVGVSVVLGVDAPAGRVDAVRAETVTDVDGTWCLGPVDAAVVDDWTVFVDGVAVGYESGWSSRLGDDGGLLDGLLFNVDVWDNAVSVGEGPDPVVLDGVEFRLDPIGPACGVVVDSVSGGPVGGVGVSVVLGVDAPAGRVDAVRAETVTDVDGTWCLGPVDAAVVDDWTVFVDGVAVGYESGWSSRLGDDGGLLDGLLFNVDVWDNAVSVGEGPDPVVLDGVEFRLDPIGPAVTTVPPTTVPPTTVPPTTVPPTTVPPTTVPPTTVPPTTVPPTTVPPTTVPPTTVPPTTVPPTTVPPTTVPPTTVPPTQPIIESLTSGVGDIGACSEGEGTSVWATAEISGTGAGDEVTVEVTWTSDAVEAPTTGSRSETKIGGGPHRVYVGAFDADYRFSTLTVTIRVVAESGLSDEASFTRDVDYPDGDRCTYG